jgi:hypothetical protein
MHLLKLSVIPLLLLIVGSAMALKMFPLYSGGGIYNSDPSYAYLFNGLLLLDWHSPHHKDHPGTTLQILIALLVYLQWGFYKLTSVVDPDVVVAVMAQPERYLLFISRVLLGLNVLATFLIGKKVHDVTKSFFLAIVCQSSLLTYGLFGTKLLYPAPEALVAFFSLLLLTLFVPLFFSPAQASKPQTKLAIATGVVFGLGFATKLTFLPMLGLFLLFKRPRDLGIAALSMVVSWLIGVSPIIKKLSGLWEWIYNMATHTGKYGGGGKGFVDTTHFASHLTALIKAFPFFYLSLSFFLICLIVALIRRIAMAGRTPTVELSWAKPIAIFVGIGVVQTLMVLKHFGQHYMLAVLPLAFIGMAMLLRAAGLSTTDSIKGLVKPVRWAFAFGITYLVLQTNYGAFTTLKVERVSNNRSVNQITAEIAKHPNALTIGSYSCFLRQCGLMFGIEYAPAIDKKIKPFLKNFYGFNVWNNMLVIDGHGYYPLSMLQPFFAQEVPVFLVVQTDFPAFDVFEKELILDVIGQKLYKISGLRRIQ